MAFHRQLRAYLPIPGKSFHHREISTRYEDIFVEGRLVNTLGLDYDCRYLSVISFSKSDKTIVLAVPGRKGSVYQPSCYEVHDYAVRTGGLGAVSVWIGLPRIKIPTRWTNPIEGREWRR